MSATWMNRLLSQLRPTAGHITRHSANTYCQDTGAHSHTFVASRSTHRSRDRHKLREKGLSIVFDDDAHHNDEFVYGSCAASRAKPDAAHQCGFARLSWRLPRRHWCQHSAALCHVVQHRLRLSVAIRFSNNHASAAMVQRLNRRPPQRQRAGCASRQP